MSDQGYEVEIALIQKELAELQRDVKKLSQDVQGLVDAWKTASGVVAFIKWLSGIVIAVSVLWAAFRVKLGG